MQKENSISSSARNYTVDIFKFIAALLIVCIHTNLFSDINDNLCFFVVNVLCRLVVPFFAVCSGYFVSKSIIKADYNFLPIKNQEIKLIKIYAVWTLLYFVYSIPFALLDGYFSVKNYIGFAISSVTSGSYYHLWYLISLIYALPLFYLCVKYIKRKFNILLMVVLYALKVASYGYIQWLPAPVKKIFEWCGKFDALFNAIFLLLPLLLLGYFIYTGELLRLKWCVIGIILSFPLLTIEAFALHYFGQNDVSFIAFTFPTAFFVFSIILQLRVGKNLGIGKMLGAISLTIYCFHPMVVGILPKNMFSLLKFFIVSLVSILVAVGFYYLKSKMKKES